MTQGDQVLVAEIEGWRESLLRARARLMRTAHTSWTSPAARAFALRVEDAGDSLTRCLQALDEVHDDALRLSSSPAAWAPAGSGAL